MGQGSRSDLKVEELSGGRSEQTGSSGLTPGKIIFETMPFSML